MAAARDRAGRAPRAALLDRLAALAPRLLVVAIVLWVAVLFAASFFKYETYGQGYDQVDFEQAIWNTVQGRPMEDSRFNFTWSVFGMDWMPMLLLFVPAYALLPSAHTLFFLQILGASLGAIPVYWLARDRLGSKLAGLGLGVAYLLYPVVLHGVLNPFQVRLFSVSLLLFAFYYFERGNWKLFYACVLLAMLARTDVAFVVAMFGVYALLTRRGWPWAAGPLALGAVYFVLSTAIAQSFAYPGAFEPPAGPVDDPMQCWPCGINPQLAYYAHLGSSAPEIVGYIVTHPFEVARLVFTPEKMWYVASLLIPLGLLPVLSARPLVLGLPVLALNLLSDRSAQYDYEHHYSLLLVPGLMAAAVYGAGNLSGWLARRGNTVKAALWVAMGLVVWGLAMQVPFKNPAVRAFLYPEPAERVAAANRLVAMVLPEAKVAASSKLAPHLLPRRYIYNFPPAPYSPYNLGPRQREDYVELDYVLVDSAASALDVPGNALGGQSALDVLTGLPEWKLVNEEAGLALYRREP
ncbi:MAG TPA: DUF2079 domain-containing protein [Chloroflexia bacterium]|nr:DUF2079 domain-containing protein [Chloroflexia bacterium]